MSNRRRCCSPQRNRFKPPPTETLSLNCKDHCIIKDAVKGTQQKINFTKVFLPLCRVAVAGKNHVVAVALLVAAVNHIKKQARVLLVKFTMPHLVNNQAGRADKRSKESAFPSGAASICHPVTQFDHLNEICLQTVFVAGAPKGLSQVRFACSGLTNESKVFVGIKRGQRGDAPQLLNISPGDTVKIKVLKGLWNLQWQTACVQQKFNRCAFFWPSPFSRPIRSESDSVPSCMLTL